MTLYSNVTNIFCFSPDATGANFCYVSGRAVKACRDVQISHSRTGSFSNRGKFYSYEACSTPPRNQCYNIGGPGTNLGEGDRPIHPPPPPPIRPPPPITPILRPPSPPPPPPIGGRPPSSLASILGLRSAGDAGKDDAIKA